MKVLSRRKALFLFAAPAVVKAASLMPIRAIKIPRNVIVEYWDDKVFYYNIPTKDWFALNAMPNIIEWQDAN
jgi:hypothetical protein